MFSDALFRYRDPVAVLPALVLLAALLTVTTQKLVRVRERPPIVITLAAPPVPVEPQQPRPAPVQPQPTPPPPRPVPVEQRPEPVTREPTPLPPIAPARPAVEDTRPPQPVAAPPAPAPAPARPAVDPVQVSTTLETEYIGRLRAYLDSIRRYPTSREARSLHPKGRVRLWLELGRDGSLRNAGVETSSDSMILDSAALSTVRQGTYPPFPGEMWPGEERHRFAVTLEYILQN